MKGRAEGVSGPLAWAVASRPFPGEVLCGDLHCVVDGPQRVRVAVIDGLGHGEMAHRASLAAVCLLDQAPLSLPLPELYGRLGQALRTTRGAAVSVAELDWAAMQMDWLGVGNVEGLLARAPGAEVRKRERLFLRGGVVGQQLPSLRPGAVALHPGDLLVLATDGIRSDFSDGLPAQGSPRAIAEWLLGTFARETDDALVLVARVGRTEEA